MADAIACKWKAQGEKINVSEGKINGEINPPFLTFFIRWNGLAKWKRKQTAWRKRLWSRFKQNVTLAGSVTDRCVCSSGLKGNVRSMSANQGRKSLPKRITYMTISAFECRLLCLRYPPFSFSRRRSPNIYVFLMPCQDFRYGSRKRGRGLLFTSAQWAATRSLWPAFASFWR